MTLATKLQLKPGQRVAVVGAPPGLVLDLSGHEAAAPAPGAVSDEALVVFAADRAALDAHRAAVVESARRDALTWVAYPKAGQLGTDMNRDTLAAALAGDGVRAVRQIAVDDVWSALRFRPA